MRSTRIRLVLTMVALAAAVACAPTIRVPVTHPAEVDLQGVSRIAIGEIEGPSAAAFATDLMAGLFATGRFELLDREHMADLVRELQLSASGVVGAGTELELGGLVGSAALVFGQVEQHSYHEQVTIADPKISEKGDTLRVHSRQGSARVRATIQITDLRTSRIIAVRKVTGEQKETERATNRNPDRIDAQNLLAKARQQAVADFLRAIVPQTTYEQVRYEKDDLRQIKRGIQLAEAGDLEGAQAAFSEATAYAPRNSKGWYNLGVTLMALGRYDAAIEALTEAHRLRPEDSYAKQIARARRWQENAHQLQEQSEE